MFDEKMTESDSAHRDIEKMTVAEILSNMNAEDQKVAIAVQAALPDIEKLVLAVITKMESGGRLFYLGAGTSGRLGVLDASECVPTFGVPPYLVNGIIAGGEAALTNAIEFAEDDPESGWQTLVEKGVNAHDFVLGISASGQAPYVMGALESCARQDIKTGSICCNAGAPISTLANYPVEVIVGPEFITGSTRLKAGTAQKMVLNMISTAVMIRLGRVEDSHMVHMQLSNEKLIQRGARMLMKRLSISHIEEAKALLLKYGSVKEALQKYHP